MSSNVCNGLKFGKISVKDLLCMKMEKSGYREFHHSSTLTYQLQFSDKECDPANLCLNYNHSKLKLRDVYQSYVVAIVTF